MSILGAITLAIAILGAVLGILNTAYNISRDRIILQVKPIWIILPPTGEKRLGIEVINLGFHPVTVSEVGFALSGGDDARMVFIDPIIPDAGPFPRRLEPRSAFSLFYDSLVWDQEEFKRAKWGYAKTDCGKVFKGKKTGAFKQAKRMSLERRA